jgi:hypothetical protein
MVQICRASRKTTDDPIQQGIDRFYVYQDIAHYATKGITVDEFPAPDGSVELVAEVVTMTKQDYDELMDQIKRLSFMLDRALGKSPEIG